MMQSTDSIANPNAPPPPPMTDWVSYFQRAEQALKKSSDAMLLHNYEQGAAEIAKAKAYLDMVFLWISRNP